MKKFIVAVMLASFAAFGQESDAPKQLCHTPQEQVNLAKHLKYQDAQIASLKKDAGVPVPFVIALIVSGVLVGAGTTVAVYEGIVKK